MANDPEKTQEKKELILELYASKAGNVSQLCKSASIARATFYRWMREDEEFAEKIGEQEEALIDFAESKLFQLINEGLPSAIFFFLKCKAKNRGYIEQQDYKHSGMVEHRHVMEIEDLRDSFEKLEEQGDYVH